MTLVCRVAGVVLPLTLLSCSSPSEPANDVVSWASGIGEVDLSSAGAANAFFTFDAKLRKDGTAVGQFSQNRIRNGLIVDFSGDVTCLTVDSALGRARIGGVIRRNDSTDPAFMTTDHEIGDDVWFRVEDGGTGPNAVDRSTTYGFKPTLVNTSAEYCALPFTGLPAWNPASTFPLRSGTIEIHP